MTGLGSLLGQASHAYFMLSAWMLEMIPINLENVTAQTLDRVIERKYVDALAVLDVEALVNIDEVAEFHSQIVAGHFVHLDSVFVYTIRA